jgi:glycosyltransferase involved in cell wall biosynthesis
MRTLEIMRSVPEGVFRFDCLALSGQRGELDEEVRALGGDVHYISRGIFFPCQLKALLKIHQYDVIHSHVLYFSGFILRWARQVGVQKRIAHFRSAANADNHSVTKRVYHRIGKHLIDRHATDILAVSESAMRANWRDDFESDPRCRVVYNGLPRDPFSGIPDRTGVRGEFGVPLGGKIILHVGNVTPPKNHRRVLEIFRDLAKSREDIHLLLIGAGTTFLAPMVRKVFAGSPGLAERIRFCDVRSDVPRIMLASDMLIHPSTAEGLPGAVLEAVASGLPVVASDIPSISEIAAHLPTVIRVSLQEDNGIWGQMIDSALVISAEKRSGAALEFTRSVFNVRRCASRLEDIWSA